MRIVVFVRQTRIAAHAFLAELSNMKSLFALAGVVTLVLGLPAAAVQTSEILPIARALPDSEIMGQYDVAVDAAAVNLTDLWHNPSEPGWGVFLDQQGTTLFASLFTHNAAGDPTWFVMSNGERQPDGAFVGELYRTRGPLATGRTSVESVGTMRFVPGEGNSAKLSYSVGSIAQTKAVERFRFSPGLRDCSWSVDPQKGALERMNFTSLWWNPGEPGWGLALSHQGDTTFGVLFVYDGQDRPAWFVMSSGVEKTRGTFGGKLYRAARGRIEDVGSISLKFSTGNDGVLNYRLDGAELQKNITRQTFSMLTTRCSS
jgi:hypothetical protein